MTSMTWPDGWIEVQCNDCRKPIGAYDTTYPQPVMSYNCRWCGCVTWIEPKVRR